MEIIVGLGGNLGDVRSAFADAVAGFARCRGVEVLARSDLYRTRPHGPEQPRYLNAAVRISTSLAARDLLGVCRRLEIDAGRDRRDGERWGPRPLDLDLLIADLVVCCGPDLTVPHPRLTERAFALVPAADVAPTWIHQPSGLSVVELARRAREEEPEAVIRVGSW